MARSASRHLLCLNLVLFAAVWVLYGNGSLHGYGKYYFARSNNVWVENLDPYVLEHPGIENVLVPGMAALVKAALVRTGLTYGQREYLLVTIVPYALFVYFVGVVIRRRARSSGVAPGAAVVALYGSGFVPYMTSWGGYVDGMAYLLLVPVLAWPRSFGVFAVTLVLQALNHYLGALTALLLVCFRASLDALATARENPRAALSIWARTVAPRVAWTVLAIAATSWYWLARFPVAGHLRSAILESQWRHVESLFVEVLGPFPFTVLSTYKLTLVPVAMLALLRTRTNGWMRTAVLVSPVVIAGVATLLFVDVTRVGTLLIFPLFWALVEAVTGQDPEIPPAQARRLRRVFLAAAAATFLAPNYYVNNGDVVVPRSQAIREVAGAVGRTLSPPSQP